MERKHLKINDTITLKHYEASKFIEREFNVKKILGEGASCITYLVTYVEDNKYSHSGVLKEFNPISEKITEEKFLEGYKLQSFFRSEIENAKNITSDTEGIYEDEDKKYILMSCDDGVSYDNIDEKNLEDIIKTAIALTKAVKVYHDAGYLHLDIKPDNIFILPQTREMVKLFDFDSVHKKEHVLDKVLSCSKQWAAFELLYKEENYKICEGTDIYSIGAIIFYKIMGRMPEDKEKRRFSKYNYDKENILFENITPAVFKKLTMLFRKTLSEDIDNRFENTDELLECLEEILNICNKRVPSLNNVRWSVTPNAIGREEEIADIHKRLKEDNVVFIRAMGGIGKSELAKMYAEKYKNTYDTIQFVTFEDNLKHTIADNLMFVNFTEDDYKNKKGDIDEETVFKEKLKLFEAFDENTLIVIDNFNVSFDEDIDNIISNKDNGHKVIFTTRNFNEDYEDKYLELKNMDEEICLELYFDFYGNMKKHKENSIDTIKEMLNVIAYNTLLIKLIALNCRKQRIKPEVMLEKLKKCELSTVEGKIAFDSGSNDDERKMLLYEHLCAVFDVSGLKKNEKIIMMILSLVGRTKIDASTFGEWCGLEDFDDLNSLVECGWVELDIENDMISLHHVISDVSYEELKPDGEKCSDFINYITNLIKYQNNRSTYKNRQYRNFARGIAQRLIPKGESAACFFATIGKIMSTREEGKDECSKYLSYALDIYKSIYGEESSQCAEIFFDFGNMYRTYGSSFSIYEEDNDEVEDKVWKKINSYYDKYLNICRLIYENKENYKIEHDETGMFLNNINDISLDNNQDRLAEAYLKVGKAYRNMFFDILCLDEARNEKISSISEGCYIKFFNINEKIFKEYNDKKKLIKAATIISDFYSDFINPKYSDEKSAYYRKKYIDNIDKYAESVDDDEMNDIEYYMELGEGAELDENYTQAIEYYKKCLKYRDNENSLFYSHYKAYSNICRIYKEQKDYDKSLIYLDEMKKSCRLKPCDKAESSYMYGTIYKAMKKYDEAEKYFLESIKYWEETLKHDESISKEYCLKEILLCKLDLSEILMNKGDYEYAEVYMNEIMKLYEKIKELDSYMVEDIKELNETFGNLYIYKNDFNKAYDYYMKEIDDLSGKYLKENDEKIVKLCLKFLHMYNEETCISKLSLQTQSIEGIGECDNKNSSYDKDNLQDYEYKIIWLYLMLGNGYCDNELNVNEGLKYYEKGLALAEKTYGLNHYLTSKFYKAIGRVYAYKTDSDYNLGENYMKKCNYSLIAEVEALNYKDDNVKLFDIFDEAGKSYENIGGYNEAIKNFKKALSFIKGNINNDENYYSYTHKTYYDYIEVNDSIARNYRYMEQYDSAVEYEKDTLNIIKNCLGRGGYYNPTVYELARKYNDIGELYLSAEDYEHAEQYYVQALKCYEEDEKENEDNIIDMYNKLVNLYKAADDLENMIKYEDKLRNIAYNELEL